MKSWLRSNEFKVLFVLYLVLLWQICVKMSFYVSVYYWICFSASHISAVSVSLSQSLSLSVSVFLCLSCCLCPCLATLLWSTTSLVDCYVQHLEVHETIAECMIFANHWVAKKIVDAFPSKALVSKGCFVSFPFWDSCWIFMHCWINIKKYFFKVQNKNWLFQKVNTLSHFVCVCVCVCVSDSFDLYIELGNLLLRMQLLKANSCFLEQDVSHLAWMELELSWSLIYVQNVS